MVKRKVVFALLIIVTVALSAQQSKLQIAMMGGFSFLPERGSVQDYKKGENDFPVYPKHSVTVAAVSIGMVLHARSSIQLSGRLHMPATVTILDPSDMDTARINTPSRLTLSVNYVHHLSNAKLMPFLLAGAGLDILMIKDKTYNTDSGYSITMIAPDRTIDPLLNLGGGLNYFFHPRVALKIDIRLQMVFQSDSPMFSYTLMTGFLFGF